MPNPSLPILKDAAQVFTRSQPRVSMPTTTMLEAATFSQVGYMVHQIYRHRHIPRPLFPVTAICVAATMYLSCRK